MKTARKITVEVSEELLRRAQRGTGAGISATVRQGLELVAGSQTYEKLRKLRGKVRVNLSLEELRTDRG